MNEVDDKARRLFAYVVARDFGFAPNPFYGFCTLATCKPQIRKHAKPGDWIVGTGSKRYGLGDRLVFAMNVAEALTFEDYWGDPRFKSKRPNLCGSLKQAFGDNIYHRSVTGRWAQADSHHSRAHGVTNRPNVEHDTAVNRVLIAVDFAYWGAFGPKVPARFRRPGADICGGRGHKVFYAELTRKFVNWFREQDDQGFVAEPREFRAQLRT
jgi:hypothetical protein